MDKKKKRDLNISIIGSGLLCKGLVIIFLYCFITGIILLDPQYIGVGVLFLFAGFEMLILHNNHRIHRLELKQKGEW